MKKEHKKGIGTVILYIFLSLLIILGYACFFSANWFIKVYGNIGFDSIIYTLFSNLNGVENDIIKDYCINALLPIVLLSFLTCLFIFAKPKKPIFLTLFKIKLKVYPIKKWLISVLSIYLSLNLILIAAHHSGLVKYTLSYINAGRVYEDNYVYPEDVKIEFPENKRNLIYIFLESMETSFISSELGGGSKNNLIPNLYSLAQENINFSTNNGIGGIYSVYGTSWTVGAMVGQTSGAHLHIPLGLDGNKFSDYFSEFLPGLTTINDILHDNGYYQEIMFGSDASFGSRREYFSQHGVDKIFDIFTARENGFISNDYSVWWGFEDTKLFEYAKKELLSISSDTSRPFAFTMLTADTHHIAGYKCPDCQNNYSEHYENVISCSDKKVFEFIKWIQSQPFYNNTTIVICGDHPTMDNGYIERNIPSDYSRTIYNCFINTVAKTSNTKNRKPCVFDMFPTTLAAVGCEIEGNRLGLGVNLFSDQQTLTEKLGSVSYLNGELSRRSVFYEKNLLK